LCGSPPLPSESVGSSCCSCWSSLLQVRSGWRQASCRTPLGFPDRLTFYFWLRSVCLASSASFTWARPFPSGVRIAVCNSLGTRGDSGLLGSPTTLGARGFEALILGHIKWAGCLALGTSNVSGAVKKYAAEATKGPNPTLHRMAAPRNRLPFRGSLGGRHR